VAPKSLAADPAGAVLIPAGDGGASCGATYIGLGPHVFLEQAAAEHFSSVVLPERVRAGGGTPPT
jgi:hypothetical protein